MRGMPTIHSSASSIAPPRLEQHVDALVGAQQAEEQHDRLVRLKRRRRGGRRRLAGIAERGLGG